MGKASEPMMVRQSQRQSKPKNKKRGRPSLSDLHHRKPLLTNPNPNPNPNYHSSNSISNSISNSNSAIIPKSPRIPNFPQNPNPPRRARSSRRTAPNLPPDFIHGADFDDDDDDDQDDDDGRVKKKVKLLPSNSTSFRTGFVNGVEEEEEKVWKGTDTHTHTLNGTTRMVDAGPTIAAATHTPMPGNKKLLLLILDKLQKKDTRGVFAEPVDPEELPDYHEIIEHPMDFGTVKKKLDGGLYKTLEQLEADINLICTNAMEYNAPSTIFFRQARSIQELAKKEFEALRQDGGTSEPPPKPRRGRPPGSRNMKKLLESSPLDRGESSSDATPVSRDDDTSMKSNSYNLRKGPSLYRFPRNLETSFDYTASASKSMPIKYGEKLYDSEENRRETYNPFGEGGSGQDLSSSSSIFGAMDKKLIPVGLEYEHGYARSLARFARGLGPAAWRIVSKKLREVLPPGVDFGPGWVGENRTSAMRVSPLPEISVQSDHSVSQESSIRSESQPYPSTSGFVSPPLTHNRPSTSGFVSPPLTHNRSSSHTTTQKLMEASRSLGPFAPFPQMTQQSPAPFNPSQLQAFRSRPFESSSLEASRSLGPSRMQVSPPMAMDFQGTLLRAENDSLGMHGVPYWQNVSMQERWDLPYQVEQQNAGFQASDARSSSLPVGSPPPLDLVLQL